MSDREDKIIETAESLIPDIWRRSKEGDGTVLWGKEQRTGGKLSCGDRAGTAADHSQCRARGLGTDQVSSLFLPA